MKYLLIFLFAVATTGISENLIAQEESVERSETVSETAKTELKSSIKINIGDDDYSDSEKIGKIVENVGKINAELADELKVEIDGLDDEEKAELLDKLEDGFDMDGIPDSAILVPIVAIISVFGLPLLLVIVLLGSSHRKRKQKMELVNLYIANDKDLPEHVINAFDNGGASNSLRSGLVLVGVGFGLTAALSDHGVANFGLIPLFLGIARLIYWYLEERTPKQQ